MRKFFSSKLNLVLTLFLVIAIGIAGILVIDVFKKDVKAIDFSEYSDVEVFDWAKENNVENLLNLTYEFDENIEKGRVIYQSVKEGSSINDGITIVCSNGKDPNALVPVIEVNENTIKNDVDKWALDNGLLNIHYQYMLSDLDVDKVISIDKSGNIHKNDDVIVTLSCYDDENLVSIIVPDFSKLTKDDISLWANCYKINVNISYQENINLKNDSFISQTPIKYSEIKNGTSVDIVFATEKNENSNDDIINVPDDYLWYKEEDFINTIEKLGLKAIKQSKTYSKTGKENGTVYSYDSSSDGFKFRKGDSVKYYLVDNGNNDEILVSDDYLGYDESKFIKTIEDLGLKVSKQEKTYKSTKFKAGTIYSYDSTSDGIAFHKGDTVKYFLVEGKSSNDEIINVPDTYLGYEETKFISTIESLGLNVSKQSETYKSVKYKAGTIYAYDSTSDGIVFHKGDAVKYYLVSGGTNTDTIVVPDTYLGYSESDFISAIESLGLKAEKQNKTFASYKFKPGTIYSYDSTSDGITFHKGDIVRYYLVKGETESETVTVPDTYLWYKEADFINAIEKLGLIPSKQTKTYIKSGKENGTIYAYDSTSDGIVFHKGDTVKYWLVKNEDTPTPIIEEKITLKNFVGSSKDEAISFCNSNGLNYSLSEVFSENVSSGIIISMSPESGNKVSKGSTISFVVSKGEQKASLLNADDLAQNYSKSSYDATKSALTSYFNKQGFTNYNFVGDSSSSKSNGIITSVLVNDGVYQAGSYKIDIKITVKISTRED